MKELSAQGVRQLSAQQADILYDPPGKIGQTQALFLALTAQPIPIVKGVYRFKTHAAMNAQWEAAEHEIVRLRQQGIGASRP